MFVNLSSDHSGSATASDGPTANKRSKRTVDHDGDNGESTGSGGSGGLTEKDIIGSSRFKTVRFARTFRFYIKNDSLKGTVLTPQNKKKVYKKRDKGDVKKLIKEGKAEDIVLEEEIDNVSFVDTTENRVTRRTRVYASNHAVWDDNWYVIPYDWIPASVTSRQFGALAYMSKKVKPTTCGFKLHNIIPLNDELKSVGGGISQITSPNLTPHLETFIDTEDELPIMESTGKDIEKLAQYWSTNAGPPSTHTLPKIKPVLELSDSEIKVIDNGQGYYIDLMNSNNFGTLNPNETMSYGSNLPNVWRNIARPIDQATDSPLFGLQYHAQFQSHPRFVEHFEGITATNINMMNETSAMNISHDGWPKSVLVRPAPIYRLDNTPENLNFTFLVTFYSEWIIDLNQTMSLPLQVPWKKSNENWTNVMAIQHAGGNRGTTTTHWDPNVAMGLYYTR